MVRRPSMVDNDGSAVVLSIVLVGLVYVLIYIADYYIGHDFLAWWFELIFAVGIVYGGWALYTDSEEEED